MQGVEENHRETFSRLEKLSISKKILIGVVVSGLGVAGGVGLYYLGRFAQEYVNDVCNNVRNWIFYHGFR